jgi:signal transduction histidine kinase
MVRYAGNHRFFFLIPALLALWCLTVATSEAEERIVRLGVYENAPKIFTSDSGRPAGIFIDIIEYIAQREGWTLHYVPGTWAEGLDRLKRGDIDLMPDVAYTAEREKRYAFHKVPALSSWDQIYGRKGSGIQSILDLRGKRIAVLEGSVQQQALKGIIEGFGLHVTLVTAPDYRRAFAMTAEGHADAVVANHFYGRVHARSFGLEDTAVVFNPSALYFTAPKGTNERLLQAIDGHLSNLKKDSNSAYYKSLERWTAQPVRFAFPLWVKTLGLVLGLTLLLSLVGAIVLKHQVNVRTRELRQINREIEQRIVQRTEELAAATERAQAADRLKSAFLATMSHELRTPLNAIIGFTGILLQGLAGPLNEEQRNQLTMVQGSGRHLLNLINDVLDISKIEAGEFTLSVTTFDLKSSLDKMVKLVSPMAEQKGIALTVEVAGGVGSVTTDQRRLEQVILNLLNNAVKFTEKGSVRVSCHNENGHYLLSVSDTGIGMRPEDIPNLFKPFQQIDTGLTRKYEGTGLGLSICAKIVGHMGGEITVESRLEEGSTFTVRFPRTIGGSQ